MDHADINGEENHQERHSSQQIYFTLPFLSRTLPGPLTSRTINSGAAARAPPVWPDGRMQLKVIFVREVRNHVCVTRSNGESPRETAPQEEQD
jgi:hypothetical protein